MTVLPMASAQWVHKPSFDKAELKLQATKQQSSTTSVSTKKKFRAALARIVREAAELEEAISS